MGADLSLLQCFEKSGLGREVTRLYGEGWGFGGGGGGGGSWASHIWRPEMEQDSMSNIWNSNCIMQARHTAGHSYEGWGRGERGGADLFNCLLTTKSE